MITKINNFLNEKEFNEAINKTLNSDKWQFGHSSTENGFKFWHIDLSNDAFFNIQLFNKIKEYLKLDFELLRIYANGQTYGLCGSVHLDSNESQYKTFLIYVNPTWDISWGGNTIFYYNENVVETVNIVPNLAVFFDSNIYHVGLEPTRHCKELRVTIAFKLKIK
jgi:hypothetical protein